MNPTVNREDLRELAERYYWPPRLAAGDFSSEAGLRLAARGEGVWVEDLEGRRYLDWQSGYWLSILGHGRKDVAEAVQRQLDDLAFPPQGTASPTTVMLAARLARLAPGKDARVFFTSGGSEAVETALKMAKQYQLLRGEAGRYKVIGRRGSYHGNTQGCSSLGSWRVDGLGVPGDHGPAVPGYLSVQGPNKKTCALCKASPSCTLECARELERAITFEGPSTVAAVIGEPISTAAGLHLPDPQYWPEVQRICRKHGVLLILDEVVTGFGRTGKMFASEHWGVLPDLTVVAKGISAGYMPLGAVLAGRDVADAFMGSDRAVFRHLFTYCGHPGAAAAGLAVLEALEKEQLVERSRELGQRLLEGLVGLRRLPVVGEVRGGLGLLCAVDVQHPKTKAPFPPEANLRQRLRRLMAKHGLWGMPGNTLVLGPPLTITAAEVDELVARLGRALEDLVSEVA